MKAFKLTFLMMAVFGLLNQSCFASLDPIPTLKSKTLETLHQTWKQMVSDEVFGNCGNTAALQVVDDNDTADLTGAIFHFYSTDVAQNVDITPVKVTKKSIEKAISSLGVGLNQNTSNDAATKLVRKQVKDALLDKPTRQLFIGSVQGGEGWANFVGIYDSQNEQLLLMHEGYCD